MGSISLKPSFTVFMNSELRLVETRYNVALLIL